jgi:hypothetical protein
MVKTLPMRNSPRPACDHTAPRSGNLGSNATMSAGDGRTTELRIRISRRGGGKAAVVIAFADELPSLVRLALHVGLRGLALVVEGVEVLLQAGHVLAAAGELARGPVPVSAKDQGSITQTGSLGALPTAVDDVSRPNRKRTIMGRYVFGDELKPGERWKRRLSKGR